MQGSFKNRPLSCLVGLSGSERLGCDDNRGSPWLKAAGFTCISNVGIKELWSSISPMEASSQEMFSPWLESLGSITKSPSLPSKPVPLSWLHTWLCLTSKRHGGTILTCSWEDRGTGGDIIHIPLLWAHTQVLFVPHADTRTCHDPVPAL